MQHDDIPHGPLRPEVAASAFAALGSEQRLAVLRTLVRAGPEGLPIGMLGERSGVTGSTLTHHLRILAGAGLIAQERRGRQIICAAVAYGAVNALSRFLLNECCADVGTDAHPNTRCASTGPTEHDHG